MQIASKPGLTAPCNTLHLWDINTSWSVQFCTVLLPHATGNRAEPWDSSASSMHTQLQACMQQLCIHSIHTYKIMSAHSKLVHTARLHAQQAQMHRSKGTYAANMQRAFPGPQRTAKASFGKSSPPKRHTQPQMPQLQNCLRSGYGPLTKNSSAI